MAPETETAARMAAASKFLRFRSAESRAYFLGSLGAAVGGFDGVELGGGLVGAG